MSRRLLMVLVFVALAGSLSAQAQERMRFQGRLTDAASAPISTATNVVFNLYSAPTGGTPLWTETHSGANAITPTGNGIFTVELGAFSPISGVDFSQATYLGITVGTDSEMTPRHLFTASDFAHHAKNAAALGGLARTGFAELTGATFTGPITATTFTGSGSGLTGIPAGQLTGTLPALDGSTLTNVDASTLGGLGRTGFAELTGATFTGGVTATGFTGSGSGLTSIPSSQLTGALPALNGSALTTLNASELASGTLPDGRLSGTYTGSLTFPNITSADITTLDATNVFVADLIKLGNSSTAASASNAGSLRYSSGTQKIQFSNGTQWVDVASGSVVRDIVAADAPGTDVNVASTSNVTVQSVALTGLAVGDQVIFELEGTGFNNTATASKYWTPRWTLGALQVEDVGAFPLSSHATQRYAFYARYVASIISTSHVEVTIRVSYGGQQAAGLGQGYNGDRIIWQTSTLDLTGSQSLTFTLRSSIAETAQTFRLNSYRVRVVQKTP